ncbi:MULTISPECIES: hypothetical protein [Streptomyces]|uniref:PASTA domain-containing protein n=1 Tax=Streptomyces venezuelae TaxID=54571 RepID=A0A5P2ATQ9_STRVZ|nr:hypothetical protein [Streptomyces venezuelae]QES21207.1 hypothetical protein DEJ46_20590 [Streptomyces venezuelae]
MSAFRRASLALVPMLVLALGGCVSDDTTKNGKNDPLPRMSQEKAEAWAKHWTESMARTAKAEIVPSTQQASFGNCLGKGGESPDDGRFTLAYNAKAKLPKAEHAKGIQAITAELKAQGFRIVGSRSDTSAERGGHLVQAEHPKDRHYVSAGDVSDELITLIVRTPCLLPPGAEQQEF